MPFYDNPDYLVIRERQIEAAGISAPAVLSEYVSSTLRVRNKSVVVGAVLVAGSGGSAAGTNSISIARILAGGSRSIWQTLTTPMSAGASANNDVFEISLVSAMTIASAGDIAVIVGNAASADKMVVLKSIIWRYRTLMGGDDELTQAQLG